MNTLRITMLKTRTVYSAHADPVEDGAELIQRPSAHCMLMDVMAEPYCCQCMKFKAVCTLQPCAHTVICFGCAQWITQCPTCHADVRAIDAPISSNTPKSSPKQRSTQSRGMSQPSPSDEQNLNRIEPKQ